MRFQKIIGDVIQEQASANGTIERMSKDWKSFLLFGGCRGGAAVLGADFAERSFGDVGALFGVFQLVLHLAVLGEVHGGDLLGLLHLALVGLDLGLELLDQILHALHVLAVLLSLEGEFLESSVGLAEILGGLLVAALLGIELGLELADAGLELGDDALASLEGGGLGLIETSLELSDGDLELLAEPVDVDGVLLLTAEFLGQVGGVGGGLLGLLLGVLQLGDGVIHIGLHGLEVLLQLSLGAGEHGVLAGELLDALSGIVQLDLGGLLRSVGSLEGDAHLFELRGEHVATALGHVVGFAGLLTGALLLLQRGAELLDVGQVFLDLFHGLGVGAVGMVERDLQLVDVSLELLLHAKSLLLGLGLSLERSLHGFEGTGVVLAGVLEFLLLLGETAVDLLADLGELKLSADDLGLLLLESRFSLLESSLELLLLHFETATSFVELMDGFAALTKLVGEVVDLIGEKLVLTLESFDVLLRLLILGLELEELGRVGLGLGLAGDELGGEVLALGGPFGNELVELTLLLLHGGGVGIGTLNVNHEVLNLASKTVLGLLKRSALAKSLLNLLLSLGELGGQLALGLLELLGAGNTLLLVLGASRRPSRRRLSSRLRCREPFPRPPPRPRCGAPSTSRRVLPAPRSSRRPSAS